MGWFRRKDRAGDDGTDLEPDEHLGPLTRDQAARFTAAAQQAFNHAGLETVPRGDGTLQATDGLVLGLGNVAYAAAEVPEREWAQMLAEHARAMIAVQATQPPSGIEEVQDRLYLRLFDRRSLTPDADVRPVVGDLVAVAAVDHPDHVQSLTASEDIGTLGGWSAVEQVGLANLRAETAEETFALDDDVQVSIGGFFNASRLLVLDTVLAQDFRLERPSHGVLVCVPNRHVVAVHPLTGPSCVPALRTLVSMAQGESEKPGGLSAEVFFAREGRLEQVTTRGEDGSTTVLATGMFGEAMAELGLLDGE